MLHRLLNEAFSKHEILALCSHFFFVSLCLMPLMLGVLTDRGGAPGGCSNGWTWLYLEVKWKSWVKARGSWAHSPPFPTAVHLPLPLLSQYGLGCCSAGGTAGASQCLCLLGIWECCQRLPWCRQWEDFFKTVCISIKAEENFLEHGSGTSIG